MKNIENTEKSQKLGVHQNTYNLGSKYSAYTLGMVLGIGIFAADILFGFQIFSSPTGNTKGILRTTHEQFFIYAFIVTAILVLVYSVAILAIKLSPNNRDHIARILPHFSWLNTLIDVTVGAGPALLLCALIHILQK